MKVIAFNGSARKDGNTAILLNTVLEEIKKRRHRDRALPARGEKDPGLHRLLQVHEEQGQALRRDEGHRERMH